MGLGDVSPLEPKLENGANQDYQNLFQIDANSEMQTMDYDSNTDDARK